MAIPYQLSIAISDKLKKVWMCEQDQRVFTWSVWRSDGDGDGGGASFSCVAVSLRAMD